MRLPALLLPAALLLGLTACQRGQPDTERDPTAESAGAVSPQVLAAQFGPVMGGVWVRTDYLAELARTQSPYRAAAKATDIVALGINMAPPLGRSVRAAAILNNHEGYDLNLRLEPGLTPTSLPTSHVNPDQAEPSTFELGYYLRPADTTLRLNRYNPRRKLQDAVEYQRVRRRYVADGPADVSEALQYTVRRLLFAGRYTATDSAGRRTPAELLADGSIRGLGTWRRYEPNLDFVITLANDRDNMTVSTASKRLRHLTYELRNDTLRLYAARIVETPEPQLQQGRLQYTLVRVRP